MTVITKTFFPHAAYAAAAMEDRSGPRQAVRIPATLRRSGDRPFNIRVKDISVSGFSCEAVSSMRAGALCWLNLPGLSGLQAEVVRNDGAIIGCAFANLLNQAVLDRILARYATTSAEGLLSVA